MQRAPAIFAVVLTRLQQEPGRQSRWGVVLIVLLLLLAASARGSQPGIRGLPFSRVYSLEDIGYIPRGSRLGFDTFGRIAVIRDGAYVVLNDKTWLNLTDTNEEHRVAMTIVAHDQDRRAWYGGHASWGHAEAKKDGRLRAVSLVPPDPPSWTQSTVFQDVITTRDGVYFASRGGVIFRDSTRGETSFFELAEVSQTFRAGDKVFVSCFDHPLRYIDVATRTMRDVPSLVLDGTGDNVVERATALDEQRALVSVADGRIFAFDGVDATPWPVPHHGNLTGQIAVLERLEDGNIAVAITGKGVFVLSVAGKLQSSLTIPEYHRVSDIASNEPGVMWLINEDSVQKILYSSGLTAFGQPLGLPLDWPVVASWNGRVFVASAGVLYGASAGAPGTTARFDPLSIQPPNGARALDAWGAHMLVGNKHGTFEAMPDGSFSTIAHVRDLTHLVMVDEGLCYAIGPTEIALLKWDCERWTETAPRIPGVRNPSVVHRAGRSVWIETGAEGVARITLKNGRLDLMVVRNEPWTESLWANVGVIDDFVVLSGARDDRRFFRESTETWCDMPDIMRLLNRSPAWLARVRRAADGTLWATHNEGVVKFTPQDGDYEMDATSFDLINDRYPVVRVLPDNQVWVSAMRSLYRVENETTTPIRPVTEPVLVSLMETRNSIEFLMAHSAPPATLRVPYPQGLTFRFFSGGYAWRRTPSYEFRLNSDEPWSALETGSLLRLPGLHEGKYRLQVRIAGQPGSPGPPLTFPFEILPPWHRTWPAYLLYSILVLLTVFGATRSSSYLARKRNRLLEQIVRDRTSQLEATMQKLNEETCVSATLAERDRLAGEIHDSVQQGLSGAILQLDTTLTLSALPANLRTRLNAVRNIVSYAHQEVQHAVWNMESPLLEGNGLEGALRRLTTLLAPKPPSPTVTVTGISIQIPPATAHHFLRIAQEATTNAIRHAGAREISIRLAYQSDAVSLEISDDGVGFDSESVLNQAGHFGLRGILDRVRKLCGELTIHSSPGNGTSIHVRVPLTAPFPNVTDTKIQRSQQDPHPACR